MKKIDANSAMSWLLKAQEVGDDDGYASHYELEEGWRASYPEVTGYIIPTLLKYYNHNGNKSLRRSALRAANWLLSVQNKSGSFQGRLIDEPTPTPVVFNTGMIIFGLLSAYDETKLSKYLEAAKAAGDWLVRIQEASGSWTKFNTINGDVSHNYHSRVSWALLELYSRTSEEKYFLSAFSNLENCLSSQKSNGWFDSTSLTKDMQKKPLLHFLAYTIRGVLESGLILNSERLIQSAVKSASELYDSYENNGEMFGRYDDEWKRASSWQCLTGNFQVAIIFSKLSSLDDSRDWNKAAKKIMIQTHEYSKSVCLEGNAQGSVAGSFPLDGGYMPGCFLSWATKFFLDAFYEIEVKK